MFDAAFDAMSTHELRCELSSRRGSAAVADRALGSREAAIETLKEMRGWTVIAQYIFNEHRDALSRLRLAIDDIIDDEGAWVLKDQ